MALCLRTQHISAKISYGKSTEEEGRHFLHALAALCSTLARGGVLHYARNTGIREFTPHDLRRTCPKLCRRADGDLEQTQFLLGHASIQTPDGGRGLLLGGLLARKFSLKCLFPVSHVVPVTIGIDEWVPATWFDARIFGFHLVITPVCAKKNVAVK